MSANNESFDRRDFLKTAGGAVIALGMAGSGLAAAVGSQHRPAHVSLARMIASTSA